MNRLNLVSLMRINKWRVLLSWDACVASVVSDCTAYCDNKLKFCCKKIVWVEFISTCYCQTESDAGVKESRLESSWKHFTRFVGFFLKAFARFYWKHFSDLSDFSWKHFSTFKRLLSSLKHLSLYSDFDYISIKFFS